MRRQAFQDMARAERRRFVNAAKDVSGPVGKRQAPESAAGARVFERATVALPVIETNKPLTARWHGRSLGIQNFVYILPRSFRFRRFIAREMLPVPVYDGTRRRLAAFQRVQSLAHGVRIAAEHAAADQA